MLHFGAATKGPVLKQQGMGGRIGEEAKTANLAEGPGNSLQR